MSSEKVVFVQPFMDLRPFVYSLPIEMGLLKDFLENVAGIKKNCNLINVIKSIYDKHEKQCETETVKEGNSNSSSNNNNHHNNNNVSEVRKDLHLCVSVLNELKSHVQGLESEAKKTEYLKYLHDNLYLPIHSEDPSRFRMALLADCTFCDEEWLRQGLLNLLDSKNNCANFL